MPTVENTEAVVRRTDLHFRGHYPFLSTQIFQLEDHRYAIQFDCPKRDLSEIEEEFHKNIRPASIGISLNRERPAEFVRAVDGIGDDEVVSDHLGLHPTLNDIHNYISSKFHELPQLRAVKQEQFPDVSLEFAVKLTAQQIEAVLLFLNPMVPNWPFHCIVSPDAEDDIMPVLKSTVPNTPGNLDIVAHRLRANAPSFVSEDERFYWENVNEAFSGRLSTDLILSESSREMSCYVNASVDVHLDIRELLLLYDQVYFTPPIVEYVQDFWASQSASRSDFVKMVEAGRLKLVLSQPEERCDIGFLEEVYECSSDALIGRHRAGLLCAADTAQTALHYHFARHDIAPLVPELASLLADQLGADEVDVADTILWPLHAHRLGLEPLLDKGIMGMPAIGLGQILGRIVGRSIKKDINLEATTFSNEVHVAHALNATLIPPSNNFIGWVQPLQYVADLLNFYRSFNDRIAPAWIGNTTRKEDRRPILANLPLLEVSRHARIDDLLEVSGPGSTRRKGRALIGRLADMPAEEQDQEILRLTEQLFREGMAKKRGSVIADIRTEGTANAMGMALQSPIISLVRILHRQGLRTDTYSKLIDLIDEAFSGVKRGNEDMDFLSKIERIAQFRVDAE